MVAALICIVLLAPPWSTPHESRYLTLLDKYILICLLFVVLMSVENFVVAYAEEQLGGDKDKHIVSAPATDLRSLVLGEILSWPWAQAFDNMAILGWMCAWVAFNCVFIAQSMRTYLNNMPTPRSDFNSPGGFGKAKRSRLSAR
jgi:hypothetical protein